MITQNTPEQNVYQAIQDFDNIKQIIESTGMDIPQGTPTSEYANFINAIAEKNKLQLAAAFINNKETINNYDEEYDDITKLLINGSWMFYESSKLKTFSSNLSALTNGYWMFMNCGNLTEFNSPLPLLTNGQAMFRGCSRLTAFNQQLPALTYGNQMFYQCSVLTKFNINLPVLINGDQMFYSCTQLNEFNSDLSALTSGTNIFYGCTRLEHITLKGTLNCNGLNFSSCPLSKDSVENIVDILVDRSQENQYTLTLGATNLALLSDGKKQAAANKNWKLA